MKAIVTVNTDKPDGARIRDEMIARFSELGIETVNHSLPDCDFVAAVGGDGTIIREVKAAAVYGKPVLGIKNGRVGFLSCLEPDELHKLDALMTGDYRVESRMMLKAALGAREFYCLNDAVLSGGMPVGIVDIKVRVDGQPFLNIRADGLILSTPTGSTAYNLSAGGPILAPDLNAMIITPICSHSPNARPAVVNASSIVEIQSGDREDLFLTVDGEPSVPVPAEGTITVSIANQRKAKLIKLNDEGSYTELSKKMKWQT